MEAAFFDLDKTVIAKASMVAFGRPLYRAGLVSRWLVLRALWGQLVYLQVGHSDAQMERSRAAVLRLTKGWDQAKVSAVVRDALDEVIEPIVYEEALALIRRHRDEGRRVFIVSASPIEVVAPLASYLQVDDAIATRARIDDEGRYTGEVDFSSHGENKVIAMRELAERHDLDLDRCWAYSDSITDLPMLSAVGHPVAVNPDRELRRVAVEREWEIRTFRLEVPLRSRVPMPSPGQTAAGAAGLAGIGAGLATWWWLRRPRTEP
ncbi:MAG: HAD-superfamily subfamily hydrolase [Acidimicrobiales bacterium]|nr:HAD-superfamily subfamily hydrolase [Acidimicrobiales bacterium]